MVVLYVICEAETVEDKQQLLNMLAAKNGIKFTATHDLKGFVAKKFDVTIGENKRRGGNASQSKRPRKMPNIQNNRSRSNESSKIDYIDIEEDDAPIPQVAEENDTINISDSLIVDEIIHEARSVTPIAPMVENYEDVKDTDINDSYIARGTNDREEERVFDMEKGTSLNRSRSFGAEADQSDDIKQEIDMEQESEPILNAESAPEAQEEEDVSNESAQEEAGPSRKFLKVISRRNKRDIKKWFNYGTKCALCAQDFFSQVPFTYARLSEHAVRHTDLIRYQCTIVRDCHYTAVSSNKFAKHSVEVHQKAPSINNYRSMLSKAEEIELATTLTNCFPELPIGETRLTELLSSR